jgi:Peptidase family M23
MKSPRHTARMVAAMAARLFFVALGLLACAAPAPPPPARTVMTPMEPRLRPTPAPTDLEGVWNGLLADTLHLAFTVTRSSDGYRGLLDSIDQGSTLAVDRIVVEGDTVRFAIPRVDGTFAGRIGANRLEGTWTQHGESQPLAFTRQEGSANSAAKEKAQKAPLDAPIEIVNRHPPSPLRADDHTHLVYELHVTNLARRELTLKRLEVRSAGRSLARYEGAELAVMCGRPGVEAEGAERLRIGPGLRAVVYLWITSDPAPAKLSHDVTVQMTGDREELTVSDVQVAVSSGAPTVLVPPLRGGWWLAGNGPSNASHHRRALLPIAGAARIAQRFAIDWVKIDDEGRTFTGDPTKNGNYYAYGREVLAVADGVVSAVKDGIPENIPGQQRAVPMTLESLAGNHVLVDLGGGRRALFAHLQPGSLKVKAGDRVKRRQVLGLIGNSGNSTQPHLHFHVSDGASPLAAEGLPYVFDAFDVRPPSKPGETPAPAVARTKQLPTENEAVSFP